jgi:hypothetical protein
VEASSTKNLFSTSTGITYAVAGSISLATRSAWSTTTPLPNPSGGDAVFMNGGTFYMPESVLGSYFATSSANGSVSSWSDAHAATPVNMGGYSGVANNGYPI